MARRDLQDILFSDVYPLYIKKVEKKGRAKAEVDRIISWLTGLDEQGIEEAIAQKISFKTLFETAPSFQKNAYLVTGAICGVKVETIENEMIRKIRILDKLIDECAKGKSMEKILRKN
ncbi:MAG: DUF2200 domain-containing protein [Streptococcaceae bacterium]|jgi:hypothetical protein|nr:DUF2200 domain-containing protein [Streptococcaceae bacterium]